MPVVRCQDIIGELVFGRWRKGMGRLGSAWKAEKGPETTELCIRRKARVCAAICG